MYSAYTIGPTVRLKLFQIKPHGRDTEFPITLCGIIDRSKVPVDQADWEAIMDGLGSGHHWLGITDKDSEGTWKNIYTGENAYVKWRNNEPNGNHGEVIFFALIILRVLFSELCYD